MYLENILPKYLSTWNFNLPYHNILRNQNSCRLTGVMMVNSEKFYTDKFLECQKNIINSNLKTIMMKLY